MYTNDPKGSVLVVLTSFVLQDYTLMFDKVTGDRMTGSAAIADLNTYSCTNRVAK